MVDQRMFLLLSQVVSLSFKPFSYDFNPQGLFMKQHAFLDLQLPVAQIGLLCSIQVYLLFEPYNL